MNTLFLKDFTVLDFAFLHPSDGLLGESWYVSVEVEGDLNHQGFIFDFGPAKKLLKAAVDEHFDHKFFFPESLSKSEGRGLKIGDFYYEAPKESYAAFPESITLRSMERSMNEKIFPLMPKNISSLKFTLREDERFHSQANFRYTHGLRLHEGNCQRLFHGHRNPLEVWVDGERESSLEVKLANHWNGAHFAHSATVKNLEAIKTNEPNIISYSSNQGEFLAKIPSSKLVVMNEEPSIENIAKEGWLWLRRQGIRGILKVVAYEGLNKGASFTSSKDA